MTRRLGHAWRVALVGLLASGVVLRAVGGAPVRSPRVQRSAGEPVKRTILALYDSSHAAHPRDTVIHALAEMPLNHLGLRVRYHDIRGGLPGRDTLTDIRGVLTWFASDAMPQPRAYLAWLGDVTRARVPVAVMGLLGATTNDDGQVTPREEINRAVTSLGWRFEGDWITTTHGARFDVADDRLVAFERPLPHVVPPYLRAVPTVPAARVALRITGHAGGAPSAAVLVSPLGTYVAPGLAYFADRSLGREFRQWYVNPFELFRAAFHTDDLPKPDTTTLGGRRIYYSHIDGDGWRNLTQVEPYRTRYAIAARVVLERVVRVHPDLPVTVGAIAGDLDPAWHGSAETVAVAKALYGLPHVEAGVHTYSHPLDWGYFDDRAVVAKGRSGRAAGEAVRGGDSISASAYDKPRMYDVRPFSLAGEVDAAVQLVTGLLPAGKRVELMQWSGDTRPFERVLARVREQRLANLNGGDTRFDREFPSATWVSPLGLEVGRERQIYASNSNENTYTDLWRDRYFGFSFLERTVRNTGTPRRIKPFNLYYHMYSGERLSSLNAVLANLAFARSLPLAPIEASRFSRIADGFYSADIERLGTRLWRVRDRGGLQTLRFDAATLLGVDFARSRGVIGQRHELGSLYVSLDEDDPVPVVALKDVTSVGAEPREAWPYLVESRWRVRTFERTSAGVRFVAEGFGPGESTWRWPFAGEARVAWATGRTAGHLVARPADGLLRIVLPAVTGERVTVSVDRAAPAGVVDVG
jgi:hypothetical protein